VKVCSKDRDFIFDLAVLMDGEVEEENGEYCLIPVQNEDYALFEKVYRCLPRELLIKAVKELAETGMSMETARELREYGRKCPAVITFFGLEEMTRTKPLTCEEYLKRLPREGPLEYAYQLAEQLINTPKGAFMKRVELTNKLSEYIQALKWAGAIDDADELAYRQFIVCVADVSRFY